VSDQQDSRDRAAHEPAAEPRSKLRYAAVWWTIGWCIVAGVLFGSLKPKVVFPDFAESDKIAHFSAYCAMAFWFAGMTDRRRYPFLAVLLVLLGGAIELAQGAMDLGRSADWRDLLANSMGIGVAIIAAYAGLGTWMSRIERLLRLS
jgi:VanZ like family